MTMIDTLTRRLEKVFDQRQATVLAEVITDAYSDLVKTSDFNELKAIVKELARAQERTEARVGELVVAQEHLVGAQQRTEVRLGELATAQQRTEVRLEELATAQQRTEARLEELATAQQRTEVRLEELATAQQRTEASLNRLTEVVTGMGQELGGLSRSMSYALENEAYRALPAYLLARHGISLRERLIRTEIGGKEINFFARGERNSHAICLVGETKLQLDERRRSRREAEQVLAQLESKAQAVQQVYPDCQVVRLLVTHYARPAILKVAEERGVLVVQSYDW